MSIKVLVADDHEVVRHGLASLLSGSDIKIVAEAKDGKEAIQMARKHRPQVVLLDIRMPQSDGLETLEQLRTEMPGDQSRRALDLRQSDLRGPGGRAWGQRLRAEGIDAGRIDHGDHRRRQGRIALDACGEMRRVSTAMATRQQTGDSDVPLTNRETQVLRHMALGLSNKEIGRSLSISIETVKEHVQNILRKIAVSDRTQAAVWAVRKGMV